MNPGSNKSKNGLIYIVWCSLVETIERYDWSCCSHFVDMTLTGTLLCSKVNNGIVHCHDLTYSLVLCRIKES